ncbi:ATP-binding protein [Azospirillum sp. sgz301742]
MSSIQALRRDDGAPDIAGGEPARAESGPSRVPAGLPGWVGRLSANTLAAKARMLFAAIGLLVVFSIGLAVVYYQRAESDLGRVNTIEHLAYGLVSVSAQGEDLLRDLTIPADAGGPHSRALAEHWLGDLAAMRPDGLLAAALHPKDVTAFEYDVQRLEAMLTEGLNTQERLDEFRSEIEMAINRFTGQAHDALVEMRRRHIDELEQAKTRRQQLMVVFVALCVGAFAGIAVLGGLFVTRLVKALAVLERRSRGIAAGDYGEPIPAGRGDEVGHLIEAVNTMARKLAERDREANAVRQQAAQQEKMLALGTLAASIAHEVGNPLQSIMAVCDQLAGCLCESPCERRDTLLGHTDVIAEHAGRMARTLDEVRGFARPSVPETQRFDLNRVVERTLNLMRFEPRLAKIKLSTELCAERLYIDGVPDHIVQVLMNLLINAADAVDPEQGWILVTTRRAGRRVILSVSDNGPGIPESVKKAVFEPFFTTKPEGKGTGLGLSICRSIVKDHGGQIEIVSAPDSGTSIVIRLPYSECAA